MYKKMLGILAVASIATNAQIAAGSPKFLGNITTNGAIRADYLQYWNQITGENECKWGSVEGVRDQYNWTGCDRIYNYAKQKGIPTKFHTLVWGSQYPGWDSKDPTAGWLMKLSKAEQLEEITEWFDEAKKRYPDLDMIDVVNEAVPGHAPAPFKAALGGDGTTGYDWIINSFRMARERWPKALLIYNDYNALTWQRAEFIDLLNKIKGSGYIDAAGLQSHGLENFSGTQIKTYLEEIHTKVGLPIMISEYDISNADDNVQKNKIAEQFPIFWEADYVGGVTMWGYVNGSTWVANTGLLRADGTERPSMTWLKSYIASHKAVKSAVDFSTPGAPKFTNPYNAVQSPYGGKAHAVPGRIEAEYYDLGGEGKGYHEADALGNQGNATLRGSDQVDIEKTGDATGSYNIGYALKDEWLAYTVNVAATDTYRLLLRVAADGDARTMHVEVDGVNVSGSIAVPNTKGWQSYTTVAVPGVKLTAGQRKLRIVFDATYINLNWFEFLPQAKSQNIAVGGSTRNLISYTPAALPAGSPLVISLHGLNQDAAYQQGATQWENIADTAKFTLVYPNAVNKSWDISGTSDISFLQAIIDTMVRRNNINPQRVYVTGFSMGGMMSYHAANQMGNKIAAIGPVSGYLFNGSASSVRPMPVLHIHGDSDNVVPYSGVSAMLGKWRALDKCPATPSVIKPYPANMASSTALLQKWGPCDRSEVQLITLPKKGHWHSNDPAGVHSTQELWNFLKRWSLSSSSTSSSSAAVSSSSKASSSSSAVVSSSSTVSSSSAAVSSSSATGLKACIAFVNGVGGYASNCYKSGLTNMAANTCYTMNPDRGSAPAWINSNANDTWWWSITSCTGIKGRVASALQYQGVPSRYQVYDLSGQLVLESAYEPQNLGAGHWIIVARDAMGKQLSRRTVQIRD